MHYTSFPCEQIPIGKLELPINRSYFPLGRMMVIDATLVDVPKELNSFLLKNERNGRFCLTMELRKKRNSASEPNVSCPSKSTATAIYALGKLL